MPRSAFLPGLWIGDCASPTHPEPVRIRSCRMNTPGSGAPRSCDRSRRASPAPPAGRLFWGCLRGAGGAPGVTRGGGVSKSATKAPRGGIGREEKRGISTFLLARSGSIRVFVADLDNPPPQAPGGTSRTGVPAGPTGSSRRAPAPRAPRVPGSRRSRGGAAPCTPLCRSRPPDHRLRARRAREHGGGAAGATTVHVADDPGTTGAETTTAAPAPPPTPHHTHPDAPRRTQNNLPGTQCDCDHAPAAAGASSVGY